MNAIIKAAIILNFRVLLVLFVILSSLGVLTSCNANSDQIVYETNAIFEFTADQLIEQHLVAKDSDIIDEVIKVEGIVKEVNALNDRYTIILKGQKNGSRYIICDMQNNQSLKDPIDGEFVKIKGILKGSLNDVILLNCLILN